VGRVPEDSTATILVLLLFACVNSSSEEDDGDMIERGIDFPSLAREWLEANETTVGTDKEELLSTGLKF